MCAAVCPKACVNLYIVSLSERSMSKAKELEKSSNNLNHSILLDCWINDIEDGCTVGNECVSENNRTCVRDKDKVDDDTFPTKPNNGRPKKIVKRRYETRSRGESSRQYEFEVESSIDSDDPDFDGIKDSDNEIPSEDDDMQFHHNVEGDPNLVNEWDQMGFVGEISDDNHDSDELNEHNGSSDDGQPRGRFPVKCRKRFSKWKEFHPNYDMKNPTFVLGMEFPNSNLFKRAVKKYFILAKKEVIFTTNTRHKVAAKCNTSEGCPWRIYASTTDLDNPSIYVRTLQLEHKCCSIGKKVKNLDAPFIAQEYNHFFMNDPGWSREGIQNTIRNDFGMTVDYQMCYRARCIARKLTQGSYEDQYNLLESYANELKKRNHGTSVWIQTELDGEIPRFKRIYICIEALKKGWKEGCRPYIGLDGCHLKSVHKGQLLSAVGVDGNNGMYPVAWAIVESESRDSWTWFLQFLKADLDINHSGYITFMSDKQKGLEQAIKELFPDASHRHCVRHLHNNFKSDGNIGLDLKEKLWAAARSTTINTFAHAMESLKIISPDGWKWCMDRPAIHWSLSHFDHKFKCDFLLNNHSESFNKSILAARNKPIVGCLEDIRIATMVRFANRRNSGPNWKCKVGPRIETLLKKSAKFAVDYTPISASVWRYEVHGKEAQFQNGVLAAHAVQLDNKSCTCNRWNVSGLPCRHAISCIFSKGMSPDDFVNEYYSKEAYMKAYEPIMHPISGVKEWEKIHRPIAPPLYKRQPGRPSKMVRKKEQGEVPPPIGTTKLPRVYYAQVKCGYCKEKGHNQRSCEKKKQDVQSQTGGNIQSQT